MESICAEHRRRTFGMRIFGRLAEKRLGSPRGKKRSNSRHYMKNFHRSRSVFAPSMNSRTKTANESRSFLQMKSGYLLASFAAFALFHSTANALDECMATLKDPHGSVIVREYGKVVARLKGGEHFLVERMPDGWSVYLKFGCQGFCDRRHRLRSER